DRPAFTRAGLVFVCAILLVGAGALALRLPKLEERPFHGDEANQAYKAGILLETGEYRYDPAEHHGPTLYYATLPVAWLSSVRTFAESTESMYRIVPIAFSILTILLLLLLGDGLGRWGAVCAAILMAISPALVFYSRYYIQETLLVCFTFGAIVSGWRFMWRPSIGWAAATGVCLGLMYATKETCILSYAALGGAAAFVMVWARLRDGHRVTPGSVRSVLRRRYVAALVIAAGIVSVTLFSSFFTHATGPLDSVRAFTTYAGRASEEHSVGIHDKSWYYYLQVLTYIRMSSSTWWTEGLIVGLALAGAVAALARKTPRDDPQIHLVRFIAVYTTLLAAVYCMIPYKTPWCLINFLHPMTLLAGYGVVELMRLARRLPVRIALVLVLLASACHLFGLSVKANYKLHSDPRNPYVYAHPVWGVRRLRDRAEDLAKVHPDGHAMIIKVVVPAADYWPLPWYLRKFTRVGYWHLPPEDLDAAMIVTAPIRTPDGNLVSGLDSRMKNDYMVECHGLRPDVLLMAYIDQNLWDAFMATRD
ncbi:MAG: TIGR03663 family protein, partial [bacterium]|nr:TIGR03663 family protein [bacterium]